MTPAQFQAANPKRYTANARRCRTPAAAATPSPRRFEAGGPHCGNRLKINNIV
jgi:hypothetical protein